MALSSFGVDGFGGGQNRIRGSTRRSAIASALRGDTPFRELRVVGVDLYPKPVASVSLCDDADRAGTEERVEDKPGKRCGSASA
jgi:hypothetical protein